ncbi:hypothetical protein KQX54_014045 [Cotesia glomerata]|uniref:Uncharacterized protein n=1 Tax=Cotesia glomerata TaxID=32391 RepID=A0AAV7IZB4_COTGL|nr:hypothetical protein KQX54_014045 [Cotesia glomerata]
MNQLRAYFGTKNEAEPAPTTATRLLRSMRFHRRIGDANSYWFNPVFSSPAAYLGFEIPVTPEIQLLSGFHRAASTSNVLVYQELNSVLVVPELPVETEVQFPSTSVPSLLIKTQQVIGKSVRTTDINLRDIISNDEWREVIGTVAMNQSPRSQRTVATQTIETRLIPMPEPGCLKCKASDHSYTRCPNELKGACYCTNCRRLDHTNNTCPYQHWKTEGY